MVDRLVRGYKQETIFVWTDEPRVDPSKVEAASKYITHECLNYVLHVCCQIVQSRKSTLIQGENIKFKSMNSLKVSRETSYAPAH
jgi:hypothetical protein